MADADGGTGSARTMRRIAAPILAGLACVFVALSVAGIWVNQVLLDTGRFVAVVRPIISDSEVVSAISTKLSAEIVVALRVQERAQEALPDRAGFLATSIAGAAEQVIDREMESLLLRERVQDAWLAALRFAHERLVDLLRGQTRFVAVDGSTVSLNLFPLIQGVLQRLESSGLLPSRFVVPDLSGMTPSQARQQLSSALGVQLPAGFGEIEIADAPQLERAQIAVRRFDTLVVVLPILTLLLVAGALLTSMDRRRTVIFLGAGSAAALIVVGLLVELLGREAVKAVRDLPTAYPITRMAAGSLTDNNWRFLVPAIIVALVVAVAAYLVGKRTWFSTAQARLTASGSRSRSAVPWIAEHADPLRLGGVAVAMLGLLVLARTWGTLLVILVLLAVYLTGITLIAARAQRPAAP
jgi:hypothetical protein